MGKDRTEMKSRSRFKLGRHATEELFSLVHRTLAIAQELDDQPRMEVKIGHNGELGFVAHNQAASVAINLIQTWFGFEPHRIVPGASVWVTARYPFAYGQESAEGGDRSDPQRTGPAEPRSEPQGREGAYLNFDRWSDLQKEKG